MLPGPAHQISGYIGDVNGGRGCCHAHLRNVLRKQELYVCPGYHQDRCLNPKCGDRLDFYCKRWGCETSGQASWNPTSSWDYIKVAANYSLMDWEQRGGTCASWDRAPPVEECRRGWCHPRWCHPLRVTFTEKGKRATN